MSSPSSSNFLRTSSNSCGRRGSHRFGSWKLLSLFLIGAPLCTLAFVSNNNHNHAGAVATTTRSRSSPINPAFLPSPKTSAAWCPSRSASSTQLNMFMGSDGGILGIGTPELVRGYALTKFGGFVSLVAHRLLLDCVLCGSFSHSSISFSFVLCLVYNSCCRIFCIGAFRFVQIDQRGGKVCAKLTNLYCGGHVDH